MDDIVTAGCWHNDSLSNCHNDDTLWGYNICCARVIKQEKTWSINNNVLYHPLHMGTFDWKGMNILGNQARQVIWWACPTIM